jgi:hypothetical protein
VSRYPLSIPLYFFESFLHFTYFLLVGICFGFQSDKLTDQKQMKSGTDHFLSSSQEFEKFFEVLSPVIDLKKFVVYKMADSIKISSIIIRPSRTNRHKIDHIVHVKVFFDVFDKILHKETSVAVDIYDDIILLAFFFVLFSIIYGKIARIHKKFYVLASIFFEVFDFLKISGKDFLGRVQYTLKQDPIPKQFGNLNPSHDVQAPFWEEGRPDRLESVIIRMR